MADLTDTEIVAACARAMGLNAVANPHEKGRVFYQHPSGAAVFCVYNPLTDRAQAMELVEKLGMMIEPDGVPTSEWTAHCWHQSKIAWRYVSDANLLRAICLCAAKVQIEKEKNAND